jgi:hypothetical protein
MLPLIGLQAGHQNIQNNVVPALRSGTGAPGEVDFTVRVRDRLGQILIAKGFPVQLDDANANSSLTTIGGKDFGFYLALHYEADIHNTGGGFITAPDPSVDAVNGESLRIADAIRKSYFIPYTQDTGIQEHMEWNNPNATEYYMWSELSANTPCALIECGVGQNAHDKVILGDTDRVCNAIAKGICKAFNVPWDAPVPQPPATNWEQKYNDEVKKNDELSKELAVSKEYAQVLENKITNAQHALA